jgi:hypothetical protein
LKKFLLFFLSFGLMASGAWAATASKTTPPAVAFHYGDNPPWDELQAFDLVVVDPDHVKNPASVNRPHTQLAAYVSVGEVHPDRAYVKDIPKSWIKGKNKDWGSLLLDQSHPAWPQFFTDRVVAPLWNAGYRTFFFDTLDSYQQFAKTPEARAQQEAGMVALVNRVKQRYPQAQLMFNRGFEILPRTHQHVAWVAAESLLQGYSAGKDQYAPVPPADREWLLGQLNRIRDDYHLPIIVIDYAPVGDRALARTTARDIAAMGFTPWVATGDLATVGVGLVEPMPRRVLVVQSRQEDEYALRESAAVRYLTMPLNYLGYGVEYTEVDKLPAKLPPSRYAGVVILMAAPPSADVQSKLGTWLAQRVDEAMPLVFMEDVSAMLEPSLARKLGLDAPGGVTPAGPVQIVQQAPMVGFERQPRPHAADFVPLNLKNGSPLLTLKMGGVQQVAAAITPWGGYLMAPFGVVTLPSDQDARWVTDPFAFLHDALHLPDLPVPDVSTESGRRMLLVHMDGDGFVSRSELPGNHLAGKEVRDRVVKKYSVPMAISVIESEISPQGLYPQFSEQAEAIARDIFKNDHVEMASHSYSHPFNWRMAESGASSDNYNLRLPGYRFDLEREIEGSIRYIETRLAPTGKKVKLFLWTGDCVPGRNALAWTQRVGVMNMNGGDTVANRSSPTMTRVEGLGIERDGLFQVFAPNQNENVYTNEWRGPFYGFERVIETFELTEQPRRLKPINIYFHTYIATKVAGMRSLDKVFAYALAQEVNPVFASDYSRKVQDFAQVSVARTATGWRVRGADNIRTLRIPRTMGLPQIDASTAVGGFKRQGDVTYIHLAADAAELALAPREPTTVRLVSSNARVQSVEKITSGYRWSLIGHVPLEFTLAHAQRCTVTAEGRILKPRRSSDGHDHYQIASHAARPIEATCRN